jgi:uncharacterized small protein (DUF1192 family)
VAVFNEPQHKEAQHREAQQDASVKVVVKVRQSPAHQRQEVAESFKKGFEELQKDRKTPAFAGLVGDLYRLEAEEEKRENHKEAACKAYGNAANMFEIEADLAAGTKSDVKYNVIAARRRAILMYAAAADIAYDIAEYGEAYEAYGKAASLSSKVAASYDRLVPKDPEFAKQSDIYHKYADEMRLKSEAAKAEIIRYS